eukprot:CAMPEP_0197440202 /NCGR_PEP_ID=MMETSP1175-20131217/6768_1 /TAXON_ID=1003142 /ORGANISM="Triceratium dubium, Strain CCMP147" /LENGTH=132 /DNA_ID=CAMNT_0042970271 /DNA_START=54 /DNA_END=448 /DNA_ORIENTATION=-
MSFLQLAAKARAVPVSNPGGDALSEHLQRGPPRPDDIRHRPPRPDRAARHPGTLPKERNREGRAGAGDADREGVHGAGGDAAAAQAEDAPDEGVHFVHRGKRCGQEEAGTECHDRRAVREELDPVGWQLMRW